MTTSRCHWSKLCHKHVLTLIRWCSHLLMLVLRRALSHNSTERNCTRNKCPISNTKLCLRSNAVYQVTCKNCNQHYISSTTRFFTIALENTSITEILPKRNTLGIEIKTVVYENDPANLRHFEAFYIRN